MSGEGEATPSVGEDPADGVFGNLPRARPGARSPRRDRARAKAEQPDPAAPRPSATAAKPRTARAAARPSGGGPEDQRGPAPGAAAEDLEAERAGLEDVAWAGVAAAAEAATLGVRLANRAFEALRDAVERR